MGVYLYMAYKSNPAKVVLAGQQIKVYRMSYVSRASYYDSGKVANIVSRIESAWGDEVPEYVALVDDLKTATAAPIYRGIDTVKWFDCDKFGELAGYIVRNHKGRFVAYNVDEFDALLQRNTGLNRERLDGLNEVVLDASTNEGVIVANYLKSRWRRVRVISPVEFEEQTNIVI